MKRISRRAAVQSTAFLAISLPGCTSALHSRRNNSGTEISADAFILKQPSDSSPPTVELTLINNGNQDLTIFPQNFGGIPLEYIPAFQKDQKRLLLYPTNPEHVHLEGGELPTRRTGDCWQIPPEVFIAVESTLYKAILNADESYTIRHHLYHHRPEDSCFPPGNYHVTKSFTVGNTSENTPSFKLSYDLTIAESGNLSLSVDGPTTT
jgi:hypothetical protein